MHPPRYNSAFQNNQLGEDKGQSRTGIGQSAANSAAPQATRPATTDQMAANQIEGHDDMPAWQSAFVLGPNVRFTRTPDRVAAPREEPETIEPVNLSRGQAVPPAGQFAPAPQTAATNAQSSLSAGRPGTIPAHPAPAAIPTAPAARVTAPTAPQPAPENRVKASVVLPQPPDAVGARALTYKLRRELARQQAEQAAWESSVATTPTQPFVPQSLAAQPAPLVQGMRSVIATTQSATVGGVLASPSNPVPPSGYQAAAMPTLGQPSVAPMSHVPQATVQPTPQQMQQPAPAMAPQAGVVRPAHARNVFFRPAAPATQPAVSSEPPVVSQHAMAAAPAEATSPAYGPHMTVGRPAGAVLTATRGQAPGAVLAASPAVSAQPLVQQPAMAHPSHSLASRGSAPHSMPTPVNPVVEPVAVEPQPRLPISALLSDHIFFEAMFEPAEAAASVAVHAPAIAPVAPLSHEPMQQQTQPPRIADRTIRHIEVAPPAPSLMGVTMPAMTGAWPAFDAPVGSVVALYREVARREVSGIALTMGMTTLPLEQVEAAQIAAHSIIPVSHPVTSARQPLFRAQQALGEGEYELPPIDLLQQPQVRTTTTMTAEALEQSAGLLESVLEDFGVKGEVIDVRPGPVVTLYEFEPAPGVKSSRVIGISDDIARSMSALSARVAVVPGRNVIGIELPNPVRETVYLRELIETPEYSESRYKLPVCLGKTIGGESVIAELAKMPHLLVAGTTGSGKSVAINTMILSLLYRFRPDECRLIMVDPKMLELSVYDGIPHLLTPVVTDPKKAVMALKWAVREMEDRYRKMSRLSVRNIDGYNARAAQAREKGETITVNVQIGFDRHSGEIVYEEQELDLSPMPYIVVVVDEMADLMMVAGKEIEGAIQRLAQMARAAGIHLIMATQRPSVDVITGTIKANFPTRVSFQVTSKIDSRTILGEPGAEHLLGQGDMLHMVGGGRIARVHGPFVSDEEVEKVVAHLKLQGRPEYLGTVTEDADEAEEEPEEDTAVFDKGAMAEEDGNDLFDKAVKVVLRDKKCSTSYIQRRLSIGYNKAASLVERMEQEGIVGPANHVGKRAIIVGGREASPAAEDFDN